MMTDQVFLPWNVLFLPNWSNSILECSAASSDFSLLQQGPINRPGQYTDHALSLASVVSIAIRLMLQNTDQLQYVPL